MTRQETSFSIPAILEISSGVIPRLEAILSKHEFNKAVIFFDEFTNEAFAKHIHQSFQKINMETIVLEKNLDIKKLIDVAFKLNSCDVIIGMGGGAVVDYGKYIAYARKLPFISIPTSASNDGFSSSNCSIMVDGKKTTVPAKIPYGIIVDLEIIQKAPKKFILAGIGDLMSNITALYDWDFEEKHGFSHVNAFAAMLSKKGINSFVRTPMHDITSPIFLKELVSSMTLGGIATDISGNSSPISGSEHLISHALDKISTNPHMHGVQVGIATYIVANIQNHRFERIRKVFERTGFFDYVQTLEINKKEWLEAIDISPTIKPNRYTFLHEKKYREKAKQFIEENPMMKKIFS